MVGLIIQNFGASVSSCAKLVQQLFHWLVLRRNKRKYLLRYVCKPLHDSVWYVVGPSDTVEKRISLLLQSVRAQLNVEGRTF